MMTGEDSSLFPGLSVPDTNPFVPAAGSKPAPIGAAAMAMTLMRCPVNAAFSCPVDTSQIRMAPSELPAASQLPSGATAAVPTRRPWPVRTRRSAGLGRSGSGQRLTSRVRP